ncbi:uncharacterized protein LOC124314834 [Daphnia pulicaria]|uniref:uncharacterized protein LOC124314834 n=1 Tax=Daphnia pulicaria TaxID=35523 RepID=UPI001EEADD1C|nr:uncharacterized protein LOC124314834 [Daphnia pulicaria]
MNFIILVPVLISVAMAAPVSPNLPVTTLKMTGSSEYMYSPFYFLTAKLKLLPKEIIMCIIKPTICDHSTPTGYVTPASEAKVPYIESPVGHSPHVDFFDTDLVASRLHNDVNEISPLEVVNKQNSIPDELTSQTSSARANSENIAAQRANFEIPVTEKVQREKVKVQFNVPQNRVQ